MIVISSMLALAGSRSFWSSAKQSPLLTARKSTAVREDGKKIDITKQCPVNEKVNANLDKNDYQLH
jgi:hypothetical protein